MFIHEVKISFTHVRFIVCMLFLLLIYLIFIRLLCLKALLAASCLLYADSWYHLREYRFFVVIYTFSLQEFVQVIVSFVYCMQIAGHMTEYLCFFFVLIYAFSLQWLLQVVACYRQMASY